ncbi:MAG: extracellular matrix/biofilm biosynthesis regulator RemA family protein, partial [Candidatus Xenobia bacterium]
NFVATDKIIAVVEPDSAPVKRVVAESKEKGLVIDATAGHKTRAVLAMTSGHVILSAKGPETLAVKVNGHSEEVE